MKFIYALLIIGIFIFNPIEIQSAAITCENGYCYFNYESEKSLKIGITYNSQTQYHDGTNNQNYLLDQGNGEYKITLYENVQGSKYRMIEEAITNINLTPKESINLYTLSTYDAQFQSDNEVTELANQLCKMYKNKTVKMKLIKRYIEKNIDYDYELAKDIIDKNITKYIPNPNEILENKKGICYGRASLFATMCRSQNIPCKIKKGYVNGEYHAWNSVYLSNKWKDIDLSYN